MLIGAILAFFFDSVIFLLRLLPQASSQSAEIPTSLNMILVEALKWEYYFPVSTALTVLSLILAVHVVIFAWDTIKFFIGIARGVKI